MKGKRNMEEKQTQKLPTFELVERTTILGKEINIYNSIDVPLFLAKEVAEWIDYAKTGSGSRNINMMLKNVDNEEKLKGILSINNVGMQKDVDYNDENVNDSGIHNTDTICDTSDDSITSKFNSVYGNLKPKKEKRGGLRKNTAQWFLTEDGLYEVLMQSRKPIAKEMKSKIKKYLRDIRKTGGAVELGEESRFIEERFGSFSDSTKRAMVLELMKSNEELLVENEVLENDVKMLSNEILTLSNRSKLNKAIRKLACNAKPRLHFGTAWNELYDELRYKHGIFLSSRANENNKPLISLIREDEWPKVSLSFNALCVKYGQSPSVLLKEVLIDF